MFKINFFKLSLLVLLLIICLPVGAYVASSENYRLQADSVNFGGQFSSSTNYKLEDTLGEIGTGTSSDAYNLHAGYQAMSEDVYLTLSTAGDVTLSPAIDSATGGVSTGSASWTVTTNSSGGYTFSVSSDASPALRSSDDSFSDLNTTPGTTIYTWSLPSDGSGFGYSADGNDLVDNFLDNGSACDITGGSDSSDKCWTSFSTSYNLVSSRNSATGSSGNQTTINFKAEATASNALKAGTYQTTINVLALAV